MSDNFEQAMVWDTRPYHVQVGTRGDWKTIATYSLFAARRCADGVSKSKGTDRVRLVRQESATMLEP